jgi:hypothetical protein
MSVFRDRHDKRTFSSWREFYELERMLSESIERGYVREISPAFVLWNGHKVLQRPMTIDDRTYMDPRCYQEIETGEMYILISPDGDRLPGRWEQVGPAEFKSIQ